MHLLILLACLTGGLPYAKATGKTHIYIDQIPLYTKLQPCAQDRVSAIVRAQASGCGDDMQLTSFACFCLDSSSQFASILSTAVVDECRSAATEAALTARNTGAPQTAAYLVRARATGTAAPKATGGAAKKHALSALEAFDSYCAKSTELSRFNQQLPTPPPRTIYITTPSSPSSSPPTSPSPSQSKGPPVAAIVVPVILIPAALGIALLFFLRRRRQEHQKKLVEMENTSSIAKDTMMYRHELPIHANPANEMDNAQQRIEMPQSQDHAVELDAGAAAGRRGMGR